MGISTYMQSMFLSYHFRYSGTDTPPSVLYFSLHSSKPDGAGSSEVTNTYFSDRAAYNAADFTAPSTVGNNRIISSNANLNYGASIAATTVAIPYFGIWDSISGGNFLGAWQFKNSSGIATPISFGNGDTITFAGGSISLYLDLLYWSEYARDLQFSWLKGNAIASPTDNWVGLFSALAATGTGTEITATVASGGRFALNHDHWTAPATVSDRQQIESTNNVDFGYAIAPATGFSKVGIFDADTAGNLVVLHDTSTQDIVTGQQLLIPAGRLKVSLG